MLFLVEAPLVKSSSSSLSLIISVSIVGLAQVLLMGCGLVLFCSDRRRVGNLPNYGLELYAYLNPLSSLENLP